MGAYVVANRVVRDGRLVAYEGQVMSEAEAMRLGLMEAPKEPEKKAPKPEKPGKKGK